MLELLRKRGERHISPQLLSERSIFMEKFYLLFDNLEFSDKPTLQNALPSYYSMKKYCIVDTIKRTNSIINLLKLEIDKELEDKYWTSITQLHWIASWLDPTFKNLLFITDISYLSRHG